MGTKRLTRVNELLRREVALSLYRVLDGEPDVALSTLTVTHVITSPDLRHARILVSIIGDDDARRRGLSALYRHRKELQQVVSSNVTIKYTPRFSFTLDDSVKHGNHVLEILDDIEAAHPEWNEDDGEAENLPAE